MKVTVPVCGFLVHSRSKAAILEHDSGVQKIHLVFRVFYGEFDTWMEHVEVSVELFKGSFTMGPDHENIVDVSDIERKCQGLTL